MKPKSLARIAEALRMATVENTGDKANSHNIRNLNIAFNALRFDPRFIFQMKGSPKKNKTDD